MPKLRLTEEVAKSIRDYGARDYPNEACGALFGIDQDGNRNVLKLLPLANRRVDSARNRFSISARDFSAAEHAATKLGLTVVGWYHSHPDHPAKPSEFDREHAWPWYSYIIVSVDQGNPREMTSWTLKPDRSGFEPEEIATQESAISSE
jgi:proteasome lid subunit RPN8/RPN11